MMPTLIYTLISALLFSTAQIYSLWPLTFISLVLFFSILGKEKFTGKTLLVGALWGAISSASMSWWLINTLFFQYEQTIITSVLFEITAIILPAALLYGLFAIVSRFFYRTSILYASLTLPALWVIFDYMKEILPTFIPWGLAPYSFVQFKTFIQILDITGIYGLDFIIAAVSSSIVYTINIIKTEKPLNSNKGIVRLSFSASLITLLMVTPIIYGKMQITKIQNNIQQITENKNKTHHCRIIQGNFDQKKRWLGNTFKSRLKTYLALSCNSADKKTNSTLNIWPETVLNSTNFNRQELYSLIYSILKENNSLLAGGIRKKHGDMFNSAYFFSKNKTLEYYDKHILLPIAETSTIGLELGAFYTAPSSFTAGTKGKTIKTDNGKAGISICLEILYPDFIRESVSDNAEFLINIANDSWFGNTSEPILHFNSAIFRAIENRRFIIRGANTGISGIISPTGKVENRTSLFEREIIEGNFLGFNKKTVYTKYGNNYIFLFLLVILAELGLIIIRP